MTNFWQVIAPEITIRMDGNKLPPEIDEIRAFVDSLNGAVPIDPYPTSIAYDESKPEVIFAAAYAYVKNRTGFTPIADSLGFKMPRDTNPIGPNVVH